MLKLRKQDWIYIVFLALLYTLFYLFTQYEEEQDRYLNISNGLYTKNAARVVATQDINWDNIQLPISQYTIFLEWDNSNRVVLYNTNEWNPPVNEGHTFEEKPEHKTAAIAGRELAEYIYILDGHKYIDFQGKAYPVIGTLGVEYRSNLDYLVFINNAPVRDIPKGSQLIIDSSSFAASETVLHAIKEQAPALRVLENNKQGVARTAEASLLYSLLITQSYFLIFGGLVAFNWYRYEAEKNFLYVTNLLGFSSKKVFSQMLFKNTINILISGSATLTVFSLFNWSKEIALKFIPITGAFIIIAGLFWSLVWLRQCLLLKRGVGHK